MSRGLYLRTIVIVVLTVQHLLSSDDINGSKTSLVLVDGFSLVTTKSHRLLIFSTKVNCVLARAPVASPPRYSSLSLHARISKERRKQLGIDDSEDEYDLDKALDNNTDPLITKIIAGSLILTIIALLVVGVIIPLTTDYGEGVCNPVLNGGRC